MKKKISIGSWAYVFGPYWDNPIPFERVAKRLAELHFDGIEIIGFRPHPHPDDYAENSRRQELKSLLSGLGLGISGYAPDFTAHSLLRSEDAAPYIQTFRKNVDFARDLGMPALRVDTIDPPTLLEGTSADQAIQKIAPIWRQCAEIAQQAGVLMVWEFEPGFALNKPSEIIKLTEAVNHPNFKLLFDTSHAHMCAVVGARHPGRKETLPGGVVELIGKLKGKIGHIHLIDSDGTLHNDETSTHAPFGKGLLDFDAIMPALNQSGCASPWWCIDMCFWPGAWEETEACKLFMDRLNQKHGG
ncbi:MAG: sugar phosphate isomerase/epimerase family protein [Acidobacteriota bacterium]